MAVQEKSEIKKILILRFSSIGDIVLTTPIIRCLKKKYPDAEIHFFTKASFASLLEANPNVSKVHRLATDIQENLKELKALNFDLLVDLHHNLRTLRVKQHLKVKATFSFDKLNFKKWLYVNVKWNLLPPVSIVDRYFESLAPIGLNNDGQGLDFFIPPSQETSKDDIPMGHWQGYVACVVGGSYATKQLPAEKWIEVVRRCPFPIILLGGPEDKELASTIAASDPVKVYNACGKFKLLESADLVRKAKVVVSNDTGLMHIAAAFQKPIVSLWGNTTPSLGMFPYFGNNSLKNLSTEKSKMVEVNGLSCRPCSKIGHNECPKKHFKCMNDIDVSEIISGVNNFWKT